MKNSFVFFFRKREYELEQLREQLNEFHREADEKLHRTIEQVKQQNKKFFLIF
jgi:pentose-5-phosphate-3-epimerase